MKQTRQALTSALGVVVGWVPDALLVSGAAAVSGGVGLMHVPSGVIVAGLFLLAGGWLVARGGR